MEGKPAAQQIDAILKTYDDWRGEMLSRLRALIKQADPALVEEVSPQGPRRSPCRLKNAVRLAFPKDTQMKLR